MTMRKGCTDPTGRATTERPTNVRRDAGSAYHHEPNARRPKPELHAAQRRCLLPQYSQKIRCNSLLSLVLVRATAARIRAF
jgi:hypothetical protein